jgi:cytochrome b6-f complex iron-sulfur subunit
MAQADSASRATGRIERARQAEARKLARRSFLRISTFSGLALLTGGLTASFLAFFTVRNPVGFGGVVHVTAERVPVPGGDPARVSEGKLWLTNLLGPEGDVFMMGGTGGLMALYWKCPHLGCTVPWDGAFNGAAVNFPGIVGWFRCPCHGSTYSKAGIRVFGPATRPMDTMALTINPDGSVSVNTGQITRGAADNPLRAVPFA